MRSDITDVQNNQCLESVWTIFAKGCIFVFAVYDARSKVQTDSHKYLWIFGRGEAKHRHRKARANTLFVIGRNIDGSVIDLRRFYLIISPVQTIPFDQRPPPRSPVWVRVASELEMKDTLREAQWTRANANIGAITNKSCVWRKLVVCLLFVENLQSMQENWTQTFLLHRQVFTTKNVFQDKTGLEPT